jgi:PEGA domain
MRVKLRAATAGSLACAMLFLGSTAHAADPEELLRQGVSQREAGNDREALRLFSEADALKSTPRTRAQMALAEQSLGLWVLAEAHLVEALSALDDGWVTKNSAALRGALGTIREHLGSLEILGGQPGAAVSIDGAGVGVLPLRSPLRLEAGQHELEVSHPGFRRVHRTVMIAAQKAARETLTMTAVEGAPDKPEASAPPLPKATAKPASALDSNMQPKNSATQKTLGVFFLAGAGAPLILGGVSLVMRQRVTTSFNDEPACGKKLQPASCDDRIDERKLWTGLAIGSFIGTGVLAGLGAVLLLTAKSTTKPSAGARWLGCSPSIAGLACAGTF